MRKPKKDFRGFLLLLICLLILAGCSDGNNSSDPSSAPGGGQSPKILKVASFGDLTAADPIILGATYADSVVMESVFNGLVRFKPGSTKISDIEPDLAEEWEVSADGTVWTFKLRQGVKWHRGYGEFTSADVKWHYERLMDPNTPAYAKTYLSSIDRIETPDPYTVEFHLKEPDATFLYVLIGSGTGPGKITKKEAVEELGADHRFNPVGTGPFMFKEHKLGEKVVLEKNPEYFRGQPKLDYIEIYNMKEQTTIDIAMDKGEIHMAPGIGDTVWAESRKRNPDIIIDNSNHYIFWFAQMNTSRKPYDDIRVRQAIAHAINAEEFVNSIMGTEIAKLPTSVVPSYVFGHADIGIYEYDPEKSKRLLAEAGYPNGITLPENVSSTTPTSLNKMTWLQEQLRKAGIEMPMNVVDPATATDTYRKNLGGIVLSAATVRAHAEFMLTPYFHSNSIAGKPTSSNNFTHFDKIDDLIKQGRQEFDEAKAKEIYREAQQKIKDEYVVIPLVETKIPLERRKEVDLGYEFDAIPTTIYLITEKTDLVYK